MQSKLVLAAIVAAFLAAGAAAFSLARRSRAELPPVAATPPRIGDL